MERIIQTMSEKEQCPVGGVHQLMRHSTVPQDAINNTKQALIDLNNHSWSSKQQYESTLTHCKTDVSNRILLYLLCTFCTWGRFWFVQKSVIYLLLYICTDDTSKSYHWRSSFVSIEFPATGHSQACTQVRHMYPVYFFLLLYLSLVSI